MFVKLLLFTISVEEVQVSATVQQRICTDAELQVLSLQQDLQGQTFDDCIQLDPATNLATPLSMKDCLMSVGATELCASCFATINEAYSGCVTICTESGDLSNGCKSCIDDIQAAYELSDDQMAQWALYDVCRSGFADDQGNILTTGTPVTTTLPTITLARGNSQNDTTEKGFSLTNLVTPMDVIILLITLIIK